MKPLFTLFLMFISSMVFCQQKQDAWLSPALKLKIKAIDEYIITVDSNKRLKMEQRVSEFTNGGISEYNTYTDTVTQQQVKAEEVMLDKFVRYFRNNMEVFFRGIIDDTGKIKETYYEDGKAIYSRVIKQKD